MLNFPSNPTVGDVYTVNNESWQWDGTAWIPVSPTTTYSPVTISTFAPSSPISGDLWWNSVTGNLFIYYQDIDSSQWVAVTTPVNPLVEVQPSQVVEAFLTLLPSYADVTSAVAGGAPTGSLFKLNGATDITGIRSVSSYIP